MGFILILGLCGTFLLFHSIGILFEILLKKKKQENGLGMFTFRQLQESVFLRPNTLAISSLLILIALCCFGYGISVGFIANSKEPHVIDYTFNIEESELRVKLKSLEVEKYIDEITAIKVGMYSLEKISDKSILKLLDIKREDN